MPVPSSGELKLRADIANEVDGSATGDNVSLGTLSNSAGFSEPDAMSDFYGYSSCTYGMVVTANCDNPTINGFRMNATITNGGCGPGGVNDACTNTSCQLDYGFRIYNTSWSLLHTYTVATAQTVSYGHSYNYTWTGASYGTTYYVYAWTRKTGDSTIYQQNMKSCTSSTPTTYTGYSTNNNVYAVLEGGNWAVSSESWAGYGQYLHHQLGWQTDNSCINRVFSAGTSGTNPSNFCKNYTSGTVGFLPDYRKGSAAADHADSRGTMSVSAQGLTNACCSDNYLQGYRTNKTFLPYYGSSAHSYSSSPYTANSNGAEGFHTAGCPTSTGCGVSLSGSYTFTVYRP
jgi:hypothetical protein|tara:strand:+ start:1427 stop:2458 length:1032 start_codon:yes stop_codon:yes gene_type:complete